MYRIYLAAVVGALIIGSAVIMAAINQSSDTSISDDTASGIAVPADPFAFLHGTSQTTGATPNTNVSDEVSKVEVVIRNWNANRGTAADATQATPATTSNTPTAPAPQQSVTALFSDLLGESTLSKLTSTTQATFHTDTNYHAGALWDGSYTSTYTAPTKTKNSSPLQQALHDYANAVGEKLIAFTNAEGDQSALMDDYFEDRTDPVQLLRLQKLTEHYATFAENLATITPPDVFVTAHVQLMTGYQNVGKYLWDIRLADSDSAFIERLLAYNAIAEDVARTHISIVQTLSAHGVEFTSGEPGEIFVFPGSKEGIPNSGL